MTKQSDEIADLWRTIRALEANIEELKTLNASLMLAIAHKSYKEKP